MLPFVTVMMVIHLLLHSQGCSVDGVQQAWLIPWSFYQRISQTNSPNIRKTVYSASTTSSSSHRCSPPLTAPAWISILGPLLPRQHNHTSMQLPPEATVLGSPIGQLLQVIAMPWSPPLCVSPFHCWVNGVMITRVHDPLKSSAGCEIPIASREPETGGNWGRKVRLLHLHGTMEA